jgi:hypothetical protein
MMSKYNHAFTLGFSLESDLDNADDVTPSQVRLAIQTFLDKLSDIELMENVGYPYDTYKLEVA